MFLLFSTPHVLPIPSPNLTKPKQPITSQMFHVYIETFLESSDHLLSSPFVCQDAKSHFIAVSPLCPDQSNSSVLKMA